MNDKRVKAQRITEPDTPGCDSNAEWLIRLRNDELTGKHEIEIRFFRRDGTKQQLRCPASDVTKPLKVLGILRDYNARLPQENDCALAFVQDLLRAAPAHALVSSSKPGWRNDALGFVMPYKMYGSCDGEYIWDGIAEPHLFGENSGDLEAYKNGVLTLAIQSTYVSMAIMIGLAAPLLGYVEGRRSRRLLPETAIFHFAGETSSGKSTLARVTQSVIGSPGEFGDYRATERGAAEAAHARNDLVVVFDEAEHGDDSDAATLSTMKRISRGVTAGKSKRISSATKDRLPQLEWTCLAVSTGPETQAALAEKLKKKRFGQLARFIDIAVPPPQEGGIFNRVNAQKDLVPRVSGGFVESLETCMLLNHGVLLDAWISYLLQQDVSDRVLRLTDEYARKLSMGTGGLEGRVSRKFAILYAAAMIGIEGGLLPWSSEWVEEVVNRLFFDAQQLRAPSIVEVNKFVQKLADYIKDRDYFPIVDATRRGIPRVDLGDKTIGFIVRSNEGKSGYLIMERLQRTSEFYSEIPERELMGLLQEDNDIPSNKQYRVRWNGVTEKVRAWRFSPSGLNAAVARADVALGSKPNQPPDSVGGS